MMNESIEMLIRQSMIPTLLDLLKVIESMAQSQNLEHQQFSNQLKQDMEHRSQEQDTIRLLTESVAALQKPITSLVESVNRSNELTAKQNQMIAQLHDALLENNSCTKTMAMVLSQQVEDPGIHEIYDRLKAV